MLILASLSLLAVTCPSSVVAPAHGYNSWPMVQALGNRLVCAYSRGNGHWIDTGERGVWTKVSSDGGKTWSSERLLVNDPRWGEVTIGKGLDEQGAMLLWVRCWSGGERHHDLYRTTDGETFEKIATPRLDPVPMQITDVVRVPGVGLMSLWFSDGYRPAADRAWGTLTSVDNGRTWVSRTVERGLAKADWPTEPSAVWLGNGRFLALARSEAETRHQFQLVSTDSGKTWGKSRTNITDVRESTPSLLYDPSSGLLTNYYYQRGTRQLKRRVAVADWIFTRPTEWPEPDVLYEGREVRPYDAGNANATRLHGRDYVATYTGTESDTEVVVIRTSAVGAAWELPKEHELKTVMGARLLDASLRFVLWERGRSDEGRP